MPTLTLRPTSLVDAGTGGTLPWTNPGNAVAADNVYATVQTSSAGLVTSQWLYGTALEDSDGNPPNVPANALNLALVCTIERQANVAARVFSDPYTILNGAVADSLGAAGNYTVSDVVESHSEAMADANLTPTLVNQTNFGVALRLQFHDGDGVTTVIASIDDVVVTLTYDVPVSGSFRCRAMDVHQPGAVASDRHQPGAPASDVHQPGASATDAL